MINYFRELLATLKAIEKHLSKLAGCVRKVGHGRSWDKPSITTNNWNDS